MFEKEILQRIKRLQRELDELKRVEGAGGVSVHGDLDGLDQHDHLHYVRNVENETINGVKTFGEIPVLPALDPNADNQAVRKAYVDGLITESGDPKFVPLDEPLISSNWYSTSKSVTSGSTLNFYTEFGVPSDAVAVAVAGFIGGGSSSFFGLKPYGGDEYYVRARRQSDSIDDYSGWVPLDSEGRVTYGVITNSVNVTLFVTGYWVG